MRSTLSSKGKDTVRLIGPIFLVLFALHLFGGAHGNAYSQERLPVGNQTVSASTALPAAGTEVQQIGDIKTFWSLTKMGGGISIAIFGVMAVGLFLIVIQIYELIMDKLRGKPLLSTNYRQLSVSEINKLVMNYPDSMTARLYSVLLSIFHTTGNTTDFHDEIANYIQLQQERFNTFKSRLSFLSDTAGALGLLGTVWGMFVTFFGGNMDSQRILNGMGLALITTLIGLVVSIILNFFSTEVFSVFNKRLELISAKADEFRLWLMALVQQRNRRATDPKPGSDGGQGKRPKPAEAGNGSAPRPKVPSFTLKGVSDFSQDGSIGLPLHDPVTVMVETEKGQKIAGLPIRYEIVNGGGSLENEMKAAMLKTNRKGMVSVGWTLGGEVGPQRLRVTVPNFDDQELEFVCFAKPIIPELSSSIVDLRTSPINRNRGMVS